MGCIRIINFLNTVIMSFRTCFSRQSTFQWFVIVLVGLIIRPDTLGITSHIRELALNTALYTTLLHFFRSSAWRTESVTAQWIRIAHKSTECPQINGRYVLIGDGIKQSKEGRKMPGVKKLHQDSENSSKAEYIFGHLFGVVGILAGNAKKLFCVPLTASIQDGVSKIRRFSDPAVITESHVVQIICQAGMIAKQIGSSFLLLDRYFLSAPVLRKAAEFVDEAGNGLLHLITKAKVSITAYNDPPAYSGRGRPKKKGAPVKLRDLFETNKTHFTQAEVHIYGKTQEVEYYCTDLLWGQKLYQKLRFVLVRYQGTCSILVSTCLNTSPLQIIELYSFRFKIESGFRALKQTIGAFAYHFWSKYMPRLNKYSKHKNADALEAITDRGAQKKISESLKAIERYVCVAIISLGLLQIISLNFSKELNKAPSRWYRTKSSVYVSEETVACYFRKNIFRIMEKYRNLDIMQIIRAKQEVNGSYEGSAAS
jgi:hypothetical protein